MKKIIITEKPSVAKSFAKTLNISGSANDGYIENQEYIITWCIGHLITLSYPEKYDPALKKWSLESLPFLPEIYRYECIPGVKKQFNIIRKLYNRSDISTIYYAGDAGREGIYIQELVRRAAGHNPNAKELVVWIDSYTDTEIKKGIKEAKPIEQYNALIQSAYMRAVEDYATGINFSRILSLKYAGILQREGGLEKYAPIAVGRVMTCVLGMVVRRERQIRDFVKTPFYRVGASLGENEIKTEWRAIPPSSITTPNSTLYKNIGFLSKENAKQLVNRLNDEKQATITEFEQKEEKKNAPLLFNLAELQNECSKQLKITPSTTLKIAQTLYEAKMTTYPRTDSRYLSSAVAKEIESTLTPLMSYDYAHDFCKCILSNKWYEGLEKTHYVNDKKIQDHYAIIPTGMGLDKINALTANEKTVYQLIVCRFLSIFYPAATYQTTSFTALIQTEPFLYSQKELIRTGFYAVYGMPPTPESIVDLSGIQKGTILSVNEISIQEGSTIPPKRYTSGSLILAMENAGDLIEEEELRAQIKGAGIGTSATRAEIQSKLIKNSSLKLNKSTQVITPTMLGEMIYEIVYFSMPMLLNPELTANWEMGLTQIEQEKITRNDYLEKMNIFITKLVEREKSSDKTRENQLILKLNIVKQLYAKSKKGKK